VIVPRASVVSSLALIVALPDPTTRIVASVTVATARSDEAKLK
jgi:hypothetical protein